MASIAAAVVLAVFVDPLLALIALVGVLDLVLARGYATGPLGGGAAGVPQEPAAADPAQDPSYNLYARDD
jgi:hypothetical protein